MSEQPAVFLKEPPAVLPDAQIGAQEGCPVCKEPLGIQQRVLQVVVRNVRLGEGGVDQVIGGGVHPLQKILCVKLVVRLQMVHLRPGQMQGVDVLRKAAVVVVPEDQFAGVPGELGIQAVFNLS